MPCSARPVLPHSPPDLVMVPRVPPPKSPCRATFADLNQKLHDMRDDHLEDDDVRPLRGKSTPFVEADKSSRFGSDIMVLILRWSSTDGRVVALRISGELPPGTGHSKRGNNRRFW
mmetsp:Transcript_133440/g.245305  ORF Transcript_133440/g.245305 Transcript_133440/m.245305 type:complete len:116 (-) Transcript_133440:1401-1748(-)